MSGWKHTQHIKEARVFGTPTLGAPEWHDFTVDTLELNGPSIQSRTRLRTPKDGSRFLDIEIEEYEGKTRRRKTTSVRLEEAAVLRLFDALKDKFVAT
ncbi:hypothetical protein [Piscinibacter gummiphilus]|uniref:Transcriptional coactivator p15 (PC4) C-terminal domain-containing protein n=1 Tax=Piscinibacter gummiphilus TaxID=946333 RepID=A0ABZ0D1P5_9BURK|nr:hypothetical protein [Piscinibacter gummiphilus]WOB11108.1 hypothetical protein RXV79_27095 [Piscinibacter gummiphilus]